MRSYLVCPGCSGRENRRVSRLLSILVVSLACSDIAASKLHSEDWRIEIVPGPAAVRPIGVRAKPAPAAADKLPMPPAAEAPREHDKVIEIRPVDAATYTQIYQSIPFSRSEYLANRSYRHDATMEILFGQLRPTTIIRNPPLGEIRTSYSQQLIGRPGELNYSIWGPYRAGTWRW